MCSYYISHNAFGMHEAIEGCILCPKAIYEHPYNNKSQLF